MSSGVKQREAVGRRRPRVRAPAIPSLHIELDRPVTPAQGRRRFVLLLTGVLFLFGLVMITSATTGQGVVAGEATWDFVIKQLVVGVAGIGTLLLALRMPLGVIRKLTPLALIFSLVLLMVVFIPGVGHGVNGAARWINLGFFSLQPSELVKICTVLYVANYLATASPPASTREFIRSPGGYAMGAAGLVFLQSDLGSAMVIGAVVLGMYLVCGTHWKPLARLVLPALALVILGIVSEEYRRDRFLAFIDPWGDPYGGGHQLVQGFIAIGSGGPFGLGLGHSVQKINYVPEAHTDMIFSVIAEELGLVGVAIIIVSFIALALVGMRIASRARDRYQSLLAVGITSMLCGQAALNLSGVVGVLPLTGVPLPLVSYGGSSLLASMTALGLLANVATASQRRSANAARGPDD